MSTEYTKGPWLMAAKPSSVVGWPIVAPQALGRVVCSLNYADPAAFGGRMPGDGAFNRESKANGLLIASAPELLEALERLLAMVTDGYPEMEDSAAVKQAHAAALKARAGDVA